MRVWKLTLVRGEEVTVRRTTASNMHAAWKNFFGMAELWQISQYATKVSLEVEV